MRYEPKDPEELIRRIDYSWRELSFICTYLDGLADNGAEQATGYKKRAEQIFWCLRFMREYLEEKEETEANAKATRQ